MRIGRALHPSEGRAGRERDEQVGRADRDAGGRASTFLLTTGLVLISRIPFLGPGYGYDPDAWRVAWAARSIAASGTYQASRFPGYPIQELVCSLLAGGGPIALTGATAIMSAFAAGCFALVFRSLGSRDGLLAALALASAPAFYVTSVQAMDYAWALAFALAGLLLALSGRPGVAGILAGLSIGCRLTSGLWLVPLGLALAWRLPPGRRRSGILVFTATALLIGALAFLPAFQQYGVRFLRFYEPAGARLLFTAKNASVDLWGIIGVLGLALGIPLGLVRARQTPGRRSIPPADARLRIAAWGLGLLLFVAAYLRLPVDAAYLIPAIPLTLLLCGHLLERRAFIAICVALVISPWIFKISQTDKADSPVFRSGTSTLHLGGQHYVFDWLRGPILYEKARAGGGVEYVDRTLRRARRLGGETVVVAWEWLPQIRLRLGGQVDGRARYVHLLSAGDLDSLRRQGVNVYYLAGADANNALVHGVSLRAHGARSLDAMK